MIYEKLNLIIYSKGYGISHKRKHAGVGFQCWLGHNNPFVLTHF